MFYSCMKNGLFFVVLVTFTLRATLPTDGMNQWQLNDIIESCELGTIITEADLPYTITQPGLYSLIDDVTNTSNSLPAITIASSHVTLNLNKRMITSIYKRAIECVNQTDVRILNGALLTFSAIPLYFNNCANLFVQGVNVIEYPYVAAQYNNCVECVLSDCFFYFNNNGGYDPAIQIEACVVLQSSSQMNIQNCVVTNPFFSDAFYTSGDSIDIVFEYCEAYGQAERSHGFRITGDNTVIRNCAVAGLRWGVRIIGNNGIVESCDIKKCSEYGIFLMGRVMPL